MGRIIHKDNEVHAGYIAILMIFIFLSFILFFNGTEMGILFSILLLIIGISYFMFPLEWKRKISLSDFTRHDIYITAIIIVAMGILLAMWFMYLSVLGY